MKTGIDNLTVCCLKYLHRHPCELGHLPATAIIDLLGFALFEAEEMEALTK